MAVEPRSFWTELACGAEGGVTRLASDIENECLASIRERIGALASLRAARIVLRLPKTRSGKILRSTMRKITEREDFKIPATIDDPAILDEIVTVLKAKGIGA